jgi:hypothetical protein
MLSDPTYAKRNTVLTTERAMLMSSTDANNMFKPYKGSNCNIGGGNGVVACGIYSATTAYTVKGTVAGLCGSCPK